MSNVEIDILGTNVLSPGYGKPALQEQPSRTWPEDRWLLGWDPWLGFGRATMLEAHLILYHEETQVFVRGPHKESDGQMYDETGALFFPANCGRLIKAGEQVSIQFLIRNTGYPKSATGGQANARIFSMKAG